MKEKKGEHPLGDTGQLVLLCLFMAVWVMDSFFLRLSTFLSEYVPLVVRLAVLVLMLIVAFYLYMSGHVVVQDDDRPGRIISTGAFSYVRHPLYLASILSYAGLSVSTASLLSLSMLAVIVPFYDYIAGYEEKLLVDRFGEDYENYRKRTGKWLPGIIKTGES